MDSATTNLVNPPTPSASDAKVRRAVFLWEAVNTYGPQTPRTERLSTELRARGIQVDHLVLRTPAESEWFKEAPLSHATVLFPHDGPECTYDAALPLALPFVAGASLLIGAHENGWSLFGGVALSRASGIPLAMPLLSDVLEMPRAVYLGNLYYENLPELRRVRWEVEQRRQRTVAAAQAELESLYVSGAPDIVLYPSRVVGERLQKRMADTSRTTFKQFHTPVSRPTTADQRVTEPGSAKRVVVIGRVSGEKGQALAIRAHARVVKKHPHQLVLVGADQSGGRLEGLVNRLGVSASVVRVGHATDPLDELDASSSLLIPSLSEGAPAVLIEAILLNRVPMVSTRVGYAPEYLPTTHLCRPGNVASLAKGIERLVNGEIPLLDASTVRRVGELHSFDRFVDLYDEVITAAGRSGMRPDGTPSITTPAVHRGLGKRSVPVVKQLAQRIVVPRRSLRLPEGPVLVISPHLDDAVLSAGGWLFELAQQGHEITMVTTMAGIAGMAETEAGAIANRSGGLDSGAVDPFLERRLEDVRALEILGIRAVHLDRETALNRVRPDGTPYYPTAHHIQRGPVPEDPSLAAVIDDLRRIDQTVGHRSVLGPVGHGGHPDHELVHTAVMTVFGTQPLYLWYDRPYSSGYRLPNPTAIRIPMSSEAREAKVAASMCYESQTAQLYLSGSPRDEILGRGYETFIDGSQRAVQIERLVRRSEVFLRSLPVRINQLRSRR